MLHTISQTAGQYRLLILDGHSSHGTASFDQFCTERKIIPLYMPHHSSHLLQPLSVSCFAPLKHLYGQKIREMTQGGIHTIDKREFLSLYTGVHYRASSRANILSGFAATGLIFLLNLRECFQNFILNEDTNATFFFKQQPTLLFRKNTSQSLSVGEIEAADPRP